MEREFYPQISQMYADWEKTVDTAGRRMGRRRELLTARERTERKELERKRKGGHNDPKGRIYEMKHATNEGCAFFNP